MQSFWDLLPASLWPTQPFISPDEQARVLQARWALQAPANPFSPVAGGSGSLAGRLTSQAPDPARSASGGDDASAPGGILGAAIGASAAAPRQPVHRTGRHHPGGPAAPRRGRRCQQHHQRRRQCADFAVCRLSRGLGSAATSAAQQHFR
jgi:hypothetical protein